MAKKKESGEISMYEPRTEPSTLIAKKDFEIHHNDYHRTIKAGDDLSDVPEIYLQNLKTEEVI